MARGARRNWMIAALVVIVAAAAIAIPLLAGHPPAPSIDFTYTASGLSYTFDALIFRYTAPVNYTWTFGDGQQATGRSNAESNPTQFNATHAYAMGGSYTVGLSIVDANGNTGSVSHAITVTSYVPVAATLTATISGTSATATVSISGGSPPYYVGFDFGDGATVATQKTSSPTLSFTHTYLRTGTFSVRAFVGDSTSNPSITTNSVSVTATYTGMHATLDVATDRLNATATVSISGGQGPYTVVYEWGDGGPDLRTSAAQATHSYAKDGTYTINVTVYDMSVNPPSKLSATVTVSAAAAPPTVQLIGLALLGVAAVTGVVVWQFRKYRRIPVYGFGILVAAAGALLLAGVL